MRERFALTLHGAIYRLMLGAIVLAIVIIPANMNGYQPKWAFAVIAIVVVIVGVLAARQPRLRGWLRSR